MSAKAAKKKSSSKKPGPDTSVGSEDELPSPARKPVPAWTTMIYMAGDNDLDDLGDRKIADLRGIGSTDVADVVVQFDRRGIQTVELVHIQPFGTESTTVETNEEPNTGDKRPLIQFVRTARHQFPSDHTALIIWNHGGGLDPAMVHHGAEHFTAREARDGSEKAARMELASLSPRLASSLFPRAALRNLRRTGAQFEVKRIADDLTSIDHLDNLELQEAMAVIAEKAQVDILGFEACLMNTVEVAYQLRTSVKYVVGSQSNYPRPGWPYATMLPVFHDRVASTRTVAERMAKNAATNALGEYMTVSALDLQYIENVAKAVSALADALKARLDDPAIPAAIFRAHHTTQSFEGSETIDLMHFCEKLKKRISDQAIEKTADAVIAAARKLVMLSERRGARVANATGVSIYFPRRSQPSSSYRRLDFSKSTTWLAFLEDYLPRIYGAASVPQSQAMVSTAPPDTPGHH